MTDGPNMPQEPIRSSQEILGIEMQMFQERTHAFETQLQAIVTDYIRQLPSWAYLSDVRVDLLVVEVMTEQGIRKETIFNSIGVETGYRFTK